MTRNGPNPQESQSGDARKGDDDMPACTACGMPIGRLSTAVAHHGPRGVTIEHQACWQSRTFGGGR